MNDFSRELTRLAAVLLLGFVMIAASASFWAVLRADDLLARDDNARNVIRELSIVRGTIYDRNGVALARSVPDDTGLMQRVYSFPTAGSVVGYYSLNYGVTRIEAAFDAELRGDHVRTEWDTWWERVLHRDPVGYDVRSTVDLAVQQAVVNAFGDHAGAAVVVDVPSGEVLALVSLPGYDPNTIDQDWDDLKAGETTSPLLNRVTTGLYQPGGALEPVMLAALLGRHSELESAAVLNTDVPGARDPLTVQQGTMTFTLTCLPGTPSRTLSLAEAFLYGCPSPYVDALADDLTAEQVWERWEALGLLDPPALTGFDTASSEPPSLAETSPEALIAEVVGQGALTVTPLQLLQVTAAVANQGHAVPLHLVDAIRAPDAAEWEPVAVYAVAHAMLRGDVADAIRLAMLQAAAQNYLVRRAAGNDLVLYGHSALAYSGPSATPHVWFTGFVDQSTTDEAAAIAVVVVVENESDPGVAAAVAGAAFAASTR